jgi:predicted dehydrogenase
MFNCSIIGLGNAGYKIDEDLLRQLIWTHNKAYQEHPSTRLVAVCDGDSIERRRFGFFNPSIPIYKNYKDVPKMDIVSISTPTSTHLEIAKYIAENKLAKAIFCEKPLAFSTKDCKEIVDVCKDNDIILAVNYMRRWDLLYITIKNLIELEELGKLVSAVGYTNTALYQNASHMIDLMIWLCGEPINIWGNFKKDFVRTVHGAVDYGGIFHFDTDKDVDCMLSAHCDDLGKHRFELDLNFTDGRISISNDGSTKIVQKFHPSGKISNVKELYNSTFHFPSSGERMLYAISNIIQVLEGREKEVRCSGEEATKSVDFIERCYDLWWR